MSLVHNESDNKPIFVPMPPIADFAVPVTLIAIVITAVHMVVNQSESPPPPYSSIYSVRERGPTNSGRTISSTSALKRIAEETLTAIREGSYPYKGVDKDLKEAIKEAESKTRYHSPNSSIKEWASSTKPKPTHSSPTHI